MDMERDLIVDDAAHDSVLILEEVLTSSVLAPARSAWAASAWLLDELQVLALPCALTEVDVNECLVRYPGAA